VNGTIPPPTMIHDNTPIRTFRISELTRAIASQLTLVSQRSAVNFACACRCLEGPVLSVLWETQRSLCTLLEVLPEDSRDWECPVLDWESLALDISVVCGPAPDRGNQALNFEVALV